MKTDPNKLKKKPARKANKLSKNIFEKLQSKGGRGSTTRNGTVQPPAKPLALMGNKKFRMINEELN